MSHDVARIPAWSPPSATRAFSSRLARFRRYLLTGTLARTYAAIGLAGGSFGGLLGIGGGSAVAPLLLLVANMRPAQVSGTTLATVLLVSAVGSGAYASLGHLDVGMAIPIAAGSVVGAVSGALLARRLSIGLMLGLFVLVLPYFALKEVWPSLAAPVIATTTTALVVLGLATGFTSGLLGVGGASLVVPSLVAFFLIDHIAAQGIAITVALADSAAGVATHARRGNVNYRALVYLAPAAMIAAVAGALLSHHLPEAALRNLFGVFISLIWALMLFRWVSGALRARARSPARSSFDSARSR